MTTPSLSDLAHNPSCQDDYDPNSMPVTLARQYIRTYLSPVAETEHIALLDALGRIIASDILSPHNVPNHDNSAMDGYAFNAADLQAPENQPGAGTHTTLKVIGTAFAGAPFSGKLRAGECVRIMTGGVMPLGADTVIAQERTSVLNGEGNDKQVSFTDQLAPGTNVRYAGEDLQAGQAVLTTGHLVRPVDLGLVASLGVGQLEVFRKLKVAFFSTGDELASIGNTLETGQVYDSNRYSLFGMLARMGVEVIDMGVVRDDPAALEQALIEASSRADVILTSGGVSVGEADFMKQLLEKLGQVLFWKIAMKPGRPLAYGKVGNAHYFGLPGNPVAVMVTFYQFVREALLVLMGQPEPAALPIFKVMCTAQINKLKGRTEFQRGILYAADDGSWKVKPTGQQGSGVLSSMSLANCFIVLDETVGNLEPGGMVNVQVMEGII